MQFAYRSNPAPFTAWPCKFTVYARLHTYNSLLETSQKSRCVVIKTSILCTLTLLITLKGYILNNTYYSFLLYGKECICTYDCVYANKYIFFPLLLKYIYSFVCYIYTQALRKCNINYTVHCTITLNMQQVHFYWNVETIKYCTQWGKSLAVKWRHGSGNFNVRPSWSSHTLPVSGQRR